MISWEAAVGIALVELGLAAEHGERGTHLDDSLTVAPPSRLAKPHSDANLQL